MQLELPLLPPKELLYRAVYGGSVDPSVKDMVDRYFLIRDTYESCDRNSPQIATCVVFPLRGGLPIETTFLPTVSLLRS